MVKLLIIFGNRIKNHLLKIVPRQTLISFSPQSYFSYLAPTFDYQPNQPNQSPNFNSINRYLKIDNYRALFSGDSEGQTFYKINRMIEFKTNRS